MNDLLLWHQSGNVALALLDAVPDILLVMEGTYKPRKEYLGDYDYLIDDEDKLIGLSFIVDQNDEIHRSPFITASANVLVEPGLIAVFFRPSPTFRIETSQTMFTTDYVDESRNYALVIPEFERATEIRSYLSQPPRNAEAN